MREHLQKAMEIADGELVELALRLENGDISVLREYFSAKEIRVHILKCIKLLDDDKNSQV